MVRKRLGPAKRGLVEQEKWSGSASKERPSEQGKWSRSAWDQQREAWCWGDKAAAASQERNHGRQGGSGSQERNHEGRPGGSGSQFPQLVTQPLRSKNLYSFQLSGEKGCFASLALGFPSFPMSPRVSASVPFAFLAFCVSCVSLALSSYSAFLLLSYLCNFISVRLFFIFHFLCTSPCFAFTFCSPCVLVFLFLRFHILACSVARNLLNSHGFPSYTLKAGNEKSKEHNITAKGLKG